MVCLVADRSPSWPSPGCPDAHAHEHGDIVSQANVLGSSYCITDDSSIFTPVSDRGAERSAPLPVGGEDSANASPGHQCDGDEGVGVGPEPGEHSPPPFQQESERNAVDSSLQNGEGDQRMSQKESERGAWRAFGSFRSFEQRNKDFIRDLQARKQQEEADVEAAVRRQRILAESLQKLVLSGRTRASGVEGTRSNPEIYKNLRGGNLGGTGREGGTSSGFCRWVKRRRKLMWKLL
jgi:hypothetical protein